VLTDLLAELDSTRRRVSREGIPLTGRRQCAARRGFGDVFDLVGGFAAWEKAELPVATGPDQSPLP
jgi:hypothetical protein